MDIGWCVCIVVLGVIVGDVDVEGLEVVCCILKYRYYEVGMR